MVVKTINSEDKGDEGSMNIQGDTETCSTETVLLPPLPEIAANGRVIGPRYEAASLLMDNGFTGEKIAQALGVSRQTVSKIKNKVRDRYDITTGKMMKLAFNAQKNFLQGLPVGEVQPKSSDVSSAIDRQYDRAFPKVTRSENLNVNVDLNPIDLTSFRKR